MNSVLSGSSRVKTMSRLWLMSSLALVLALLVGCVPIQRVVAPKPITLRFAISDGEGRPSDPYVHEFVDQVHNLSNGAITIEPVWDAGSDTFAGFERGVLQRLLTGKFDLGLVASRSWDSESITNFQALQAPFLITNDALAEAVATSDIARRMLDSLSPLGLVGLTMWPEDLRHPFSVVPDKPLLSPTDFTGLNVRAGPSDVTYQIIDTLGAIPMFQDDGYQGAESGLRQGYSLTGKPIATGNVTFYPKYQILFANGAVFARLTSQQQTVLRQAAAATQQKAITEHPKEVDAATAWCADGGTIVLTSDEQVAAFEKATQPVFDHLAEDPLNAKLIAAIRALKASTTPSAGAAACAPVATEQSPAPAAESQTWSPGLPPNGVWQATLTVDDLVRMGDLRSTAADWAGVRTLTFQDGTFLNVFDNGHGFTGKCQAHYAVVDDFVRFTFFSDIDECPGEIDDIQWRIDAEGLHLHLVDIQNSQPVENRAYLEAKPWQEVK